MAERVLAVRLAPREFRAGHRDDRGQGIRKVVDGIKEYGDGIGREAHGCLEGCEQDVDDDAHEASPHDDAAACRHLLLHGRLFF